MWHDTVSPAYCALVPEDTQRKTHEHCQRFSARYLDQLHCLSSDGCIAWSEQSSVTLCAQLGFVFRPFDEGHVGHTYSYNRRVTEAEYQALCGQPEQRGRLWHALKW